MEDIEPEDRLGRAMIDPRVIDPRRELVPRTDLSDTEVDEIVELMAALRAWHGAAARMSEASRQYMKLNENDMRALRFMIAAENAGEIATARAVADHLRISSAATTKMLDRLERGGHVVRRPHPVDRRAIALSVTPETRQAARESVGRVHARRFEVAAGLSSAERSIVTRFLRALAATERTESTQDGPTGGDAAE
ncbi:MarR family winged helix-turn-helix transcriptional regulator [Microbacterium azadirachtae]|uniref:MarR family winged helix-turn-helix transcriptional regulator n=1 Tax=Microbacterium azadirachtae TaxID=582680 RepID=UPI00088AD8E8|nr:MarR family transcriptional regulator [Microbacterium azadirachtae]SDM38322.1 DNA-binding transcriptional regulator, MarR family [Microbacterium azadirachtae]SEG54084.1 DNA-binding transcriptional regulator, MarR family [Microbacterium azadirachtae]SEG56953.1 DNA-binding transcriptional regulator, MarR family [Microbacterium azadirachtae]